MEILNCISGLRNSRRGREFGALGLVMVLGNCLAAEAPAPTIDEYKVKAAFLYNFARFVEWPAGTFQKVTDPFAICVLGEDPFGQSLEDTVATRVIDSRPLVVRHISSAKQAAGCQIVFISSADSRRLLPTLADLRFPGVLTIGEGDAAGEYGLIINFRLEAAKVRFDINLEAADREKLRISSRLLSLAHIVESSRK